ncbi:hypothetical protein WHR41_07452 [Cladosporium halotolerans]|uniref:Fungal N-terminal domain-containing protein n=1 Tax=Cladosporium halotolerans TaxID=1052096 RepID=A0AB34KFM0_9PEZI
MSDPVSIAAATAGFISLTAQMTEGAIKLREIYITVKNIPGQVKELSDEMDMLRDLLEQAGARIQSADQINVDDKCLKSIFTNLEKTRYQTVAVLQKVNFGLEKSKLSALKAPFKKNEIEEMILGVERGKTSLLLALQIFESGQVAHRHNLSTQGQSTLSAQQLQLAQQCARIEVTTATTEKEQIQGFTRLSQDLSDSTTRLVHESHSIKALQSETRHVAPAVSE